LRKQNEALMEELRAKQQAEQPNQTAQALGEKSAADGSFETMIKQAHAAAQRKMGQALERRQEVMALEREEHRQGAPEESGATSFAELDFLSGQVAEFKRQEEESIREMGTVGLETSVEVESLRAEVARLSKELQGAPAARSGEVASLKRQLEEARRQASNTDAQRPYSTAVSSVPELTMGQDASKAQVVELNRQVEELRVFKSRALAAEAKVVQISQGLAEGPRSAAEAASAKAEAQRSASEAAAAKAEVATLSMQLQKLQDVAASRATVDHADTNTLKARVASLEEELAASSGLKTRQLEETQKSDAKIAELTAKLEDIQKGQSHALEMEGSFRESFNTQLQVLLAQLEESRRSENDARNCLDAKERQVAELTKELDNSRQKVKEMNLTMAQVGTLMKNTITHTPRKSGGQKSDASTRPPTSQRESMTPSEKALGQQSNDSNSILPTIPTAAKASHK
jgi:hypothetical protein